MAERLPGDAVAVLSPATVQDDDLTKIVRLHALAFARRTSPAQVVFAETEGLTGTLSLLRTEIASNFGLLKAQPERDAKWIESTLQMAIVRQAA